MIRLHQVFGVHAGRDVELDRPTIRIGRLPDNDIAFDGHADLDASARHAEIRRVEAGYVVVDLGSRNGTYVNRERIDGPRALAVGDQIEFGRGGPRLRVDFVGEASEQRLPSLPPTQERVVPLTRPPGAPGSLVGHSKPPPSGELARLFHALKPWRGEGPRTSGHGNLELTGVGFAVVLLFCAAALVGAFLIIG